MSGITDLLRFWRAPAGQPPPDDGLEDAEEEAYWRRRTLRRRQGYFTLSLIAMLLLALLLWHRTIISIKSGQVGVQFRYFSGTEMNEIYGEGVHLIWPWNRMVIYDMRLQTRQRQYRLLTKGGLPVVLDVAIRYRPDVRLLPLLHVTVGPTYLDTVVFPETEAVLRRTVGQYEPEELYTSRRGVLESIVVGALASVEGRYVIIDDVLVRSIELPEPVRQAIERKLVLEEEQKAYDARLAIERREAERRAVEARGIETYHEIIGRSLTPDLLRWQGIQATRDLATSPNAKTVIIGSGPNGLPLILNTER